TPTGCGDRGAMASTLDAAEGRSTAGVRVPVTGSAVGLLIGGECPQVPPGGHLQGCVYGRGCGRGGLVCGSAERQRVGWSTSMEARFRAAGAGLRPAVG